MTKLTYDSCLFFRFKSLKIKKIQINNIFILANNNFASNKKETNKLAKIMTKDKKYLTFAYPLKFNGAQI